MNIYDQTRHLTDCQTDTVRREASEGEGGREIEGWSQDAENI